jgi:hypothetical protein
MSRITKIFASAMTAAFVGSAALAGGLSDAAVEPQPLVEQTKPVSSLGVVAPLLLLAVIAAAAGGGSSNGTTPAN